MNATSENTVYTIRLEGHIDARWSEWLDGMNITQLENGETLLSGPLIDQTALHGLLAKIRDMNLKLVAIYQES